MDASRTPFANSTGADAITNKRIGLFFGTRPQVIKASVLRGALRQVAPTVAVDTGQHYDWSLHQIHYEQLSVLPPDAFLAVGSGSHAEQTAAILRACEEWLRSTPVDAAVVIGDTNSTLACALAAAKRRIPVVHVEAGLRAADSLMAEEINRRAVDAIASVLLAPCERAAEALRRARPEADVRVAGDVAYDVLLRALPLAPQAVAAHLLGDGAARPYAYATLHRAELVDEPVRLGRIIHALGNLPLRVILAVHPRTRAAIGRARIRPQGNISVVDPIGYLDSLGLSRDARLIVTDSGGLQREAYWLGVPCITVRSETEWVETVACGANRLLPPEEADALREMAYDILSRNGSIDWERGAYGDGAASERSADAVRDCLDRTSRSSL